MICGILYSEMEHLFEQYPETGRWHLSKEFMDWLRENNIHVKEQEFIVENSINLFGLLFETDEDVMAVRLRWM